MTAKKIVLDEKPTFELNNYDIHKQLFSKIDPPDENKLTKMLTNVGAWFSTDMACNYYMLMCKEISYYTVFHFNNMNYDKGVAELKKTLQFRGTILDIVYVHAEDAYECWVKNPNGEVEMYYLFKYNWGVIEIS